MKRPYLVRRLASEPRRFVPTSLFSYNMWQAPAEHAVQSSLAVKVGSAYLAHLLQGDTSVIVGVTKHICHALDVFSTCNLKIQPELLWSRQSVNRSQSPR